LVCRSSALALRALHSTAQHSTARHGTTCSVVVNYTLQLVVHTNKQPVQTCNISCAFGIARCVSHSTKSVPPSQRRCKMHAMDATVWWKEHSCLRLPGWQQHGAGKPHP
jgi:hypothetical protein